MSKIRLLIVDDEQSTIRIIKKMIDFEAYGMELIGEAHNGDEAMTFLHAKEPPEIVITDMNMAVMDGVSLMRYIQENTKDVKLIVVSGYVNYPYTHAAIRANVVDYIMKPVDPKELKKALHECCKRVAEARKLSVQNSDERMNLEVDVYQFLLKGTNELLRMISYRNHKECDKCLDKLLDRLKKEEADEKIGPAVYRIMMASLQRFLAENDMDILAADRLRQADVHTCADAVGLMRSVVHELIQDMEEKKVGKRSLEEVLDYINSHYNENLRLETIADMFHYNKEYLTTIFKKKYGLNVGEYVIHLKIEAAKRQLKYTTKSMDEIMESLGYADASYFYRQFKKVEGISPGQYRKEIQKIIQDEYK